MITLTKLDDTLEKQFSEQIRQVREFYFKQEVKEMKEEDGLDEERTRKKSE